MADIFRHDRQEPRKFEFTLPERSCRNWACDCAVCELKRIEFIHLCMPARSSDSSWPPFLRGMAMGVYGMLMLLSEADGDHIDVFIGPDVDRGNVYIVNQNKPDGSFDEHKAMLAYASEADARAGYLANYSKDWKGLGSIVRKDLAEFKTWIHEGDTSKRAAATGAPSETLAAYQPPPSKLRKAASHGHDTQDHHPRGDQQHAGGGESRTLAGGVQDQPGGHERVGAGPKEAARRPAGRQADPAREKPEGAGDRLVFHGTVFVAPANLPWTHREWINDLLGVPPPACFDFEECTRGYLLGDELRCYKGDFDHRVSATDVQMVLDVLPAKVVAFGAIPSSTSPWPAKSDMSVEHFLAITHYRQSLPAIRTQEKS